MIKFIKRFIFTVLVFGGFSSSPLLAEETTVIRFVDVGAGICTLVKAPGAQLVFSDELGDSDYCLQAAEELFGEQKVIDLLIYASATLNTNAFEHTFRKSFEAWNMVHLDVPDPLKFILREMGKLEDDQNDPRLVDLKSFPIGDAIATVVSIDGSDNAEERFGVSLTYANIDILLLGGIPAIDGDGPDPYCPVAGETADSSELEAQILFVPTGNGRNIASTCLIESISPHFVILSAGHGNALPSSDAVARYVAAGVASRNILRTDRGDNEGNGEWEDAFTLPGCIDQAGDDSITARLSKSGLIKVEYDKAFSKCWELADE